MGRFVSERLERHHDLSGFCSGVPELDRWLVEYAAHAQSMRTAQTFVWQEGDDRVIGYFSLAAHLVVRSELPKGVGRGSPASIPAVLLARLALDESFHGQGLGGELLWDALSRTVIASENVAARLVVVDAINSQASAFYRHHGFTAVPGDFHRLVQKMSDIAAAVGGQ